MSILLFVVFFFKMVTHEALLELKSTLLMTPDTDPIRSLSNLMSSLWLPMSDPFQSHGAQLSSRTIFYVALIIVRQDFSRMTQVFHVRFRGHAKRRAST